MYELTTRKYWGDKDEETIGFYCLGGKKEHKPKYWEMIDKYTKDIQAVLGLEIEPAYKSIHIGDYDEEMVYFVYYFINTN